MLSIQNEVISLVTVHSKELWLVEKNHATVKPAVKPNASIAPHGMKTYSKSRIELQNLQILKKMLEKSSLFLSSEQPCEPKSLYWTLPWKLQELKKYPRKTCGRGQPRSQLIQVLNERSINDSGDFCLLWLSIQFGIVSETHFSCDTVGCDLKWAETFESESKVTCLFYRF